MKKILLVCSSGGHLDQLLIVVPSLLAAGHSLSIATFNKPDVRAKIEDLTFYPLSWPTNRSLIRTAINAVRALHAMRRERPDVLLSSGAAPAVPFFYLGKLLFRTTNVFLECFDRVDNATLTAKLVRPVTDTFVIQWPSQLAGWKNTVQLGPSR